MVLLNKPPGCLPSNLWMFFARKRGLDGYGISETKHKDLDHQCLVDVTSLDRPRHLPVSRSRAESRRHDKSTAIRVSKREVKGCFGHFLSSFVDMNSSQNKTTQENNSRFAKKTCKQKQLLFSCKAVPKMTSRRTLRGQAVQWPASLRDHRRPGHGFKLWSQSSIQTLDLQFKYCFLYKKKQRSKKIHIPFLYLWKNPRTQEPTFFLRSKQVTKTQEIFIEKFTAIPRPQSQADHRWGAENSMGPSFKRLSTFRWKDMEQKPMN